jgi:glycosyltransferase involved in cell wall biosynthesis
MRILHFHSDNDAMIAQHVEMLVTGMGQGTVHHVATEGQQALVLLEGGHYDLVHLHGCWRNSTRKIVAAALRQGARLVLTPHGQLNPWVMEDNYWQEKLPKRVFYQRAIVRQAYAVIIQGAIEQECMQKLKWNSRQVMIRNAVVTHSITPEEMASKTYDVYWKIINSNPLSLMTDDTRVALKNLLKAGITGDVRWLDDMTAPHDVTEWRKILCFAHQEHVEDTLQRGIRVMGLEAPDIDATQIPYFLPDDYEEAETIQQTIGNQFATENDRLMATFRTLRRLSADRQLRIAHLVELDRELRRHACQEDILADDLAEYKLLKLARRIMQLMAEKTGLTDGFMPVLPLNDRTTRTLSKRITNNLKI